MWSKKLALTLFIDGQSTDLEKLPLTIVLSNKTDKQLDVRIPVNPKQLTVYVLTKRGKDSRLQDLLSWVGAFTTERQNLTLKPKGELTFKRYFDLSNFMDEIAEKPFVEFEANFVLYLKKRKVRIDSNIARYNLPKTLK